MTRLRAILVRHRHLECACVDACGNRSRSRRTDASSRPGPARRPTQPVVAQPAPARPAPATACRPRSLPPRQHRLPPHSDDSAAGYVGSDTCVLCHTEQETSLTGSKHGQAKNPRSPAADHRVRELPRSRAGARGRRRQGAHQEVRAHEAGRGERDLSHLPQPRRARGLGRQRARRAEPHLHDLPQRAHAAIDAEPAGEVDRDAGVRHAVTGCR